MSMTVFYKQSVMERRRKARSDVDACAQSLLSLKHTDSYYAQEHHALLEILRRVAEIYEAAPDDLPPNVEVSGRPHLDTIKEK